jgi:hypothetical protein
MSIIVSCSDEQPAAEPSTAESSPGTAAALTDQPLARYRAGLLGLAFRAASAIPIDPHVKDRSRQQEGVVAACLELRQPALALRYLEVIADWRRGSCYADLALHCVRYGLRVDVEGYLTLAAAIADEHERSEDAQAWRCDRIRSKIAVVRMSLGQLAAAERLTSGLVLEEVGRVQVERARRVDPERFEEQMAALRAVSPTAEMVHVQNALAVLTELYGSYYTDAERRTTIESTAMALMEKLPVGARVVALERLAEQPLRNGDVDGARSLVERIHALLGGASWQLEQEVPVRARIAELLFRVGQRSEAGAAIGAAATMFDARRGEVHDVFRAAALRPVAEAYQAIGDRDAALSAYARVLEEGVANPNSRPRAIDLSATCVSMAVHGVEPDAPLRARIDEILEGLGDPW